MGVIFSLMLMLPLAEKKLQKSISDDRNNTITEMNELSDILRLYNLFLKNEVGSNNKKGESYFLKDYCNNFNKLDKTGNGVRYALFDMTNDGIPELHVLTDISYSVHTVEGKKLITWYEGDRYRRPLNNKAILGKTEKWARAVIMGTLYEKNKMNKLIKVSGINKRMKYWHSQEDWSRFYNPTTKIVSNLGVKVIKYKKYAETIFYEV